MNDNTNKNLYSIQFCKFVAPNFFHGVVLGKDSTQFNDLLFVLNALIAC